MQSTVGRLLAFSLNLSGVRPLLCRHVTLLPLFSNTKPLSKGLILFQSVAAMMTFIFTLRLLIERKIKRLASTKDLSLFQLKIEHHQYLKRKKGLIFIENYFNFKWRNYFRYEMITILLKMIIIL